jgi:hypothetical protein
MQEKSTNIFENSTENSIGFRIKQLLEHMKLSVPELEEEGGVGNGTLKTWKDKPLDYSTNTVKAFRLKLRISEKWWETGEGDPFITLDVKNDQPTISKEERLIATLERAVDSLGRQNEELIQIVKELTAKVSISNTGQ